MDSLPVEVYDDVLELLRRGVRLFVLKRLCGLSHLRDTNDIKKTHENDAKLLSTLEGNLYRELSRDEIRLRKLIIEYNKYSRLLRIVKQLKGGSRPFNEARRIMLREKIRFAREIARMAETTLPDYKRVCESLQLSRSNLYGKVALADMPLNIDFKRGLRKILSYLGRHQHNRRYYNKRMKIALESLSIAYYKRFKVSAKEHQETGSWWTGLMAGKRTV